MVVAAVVAAHSMAFAAVVAVAVALAVAAVTVLLALLAAGGDPDTGQGTAPDAHGRPARTEGHISVQLTLKKPSLLVMSLLNM